jgi:hypothetical protein
MADADSGVALRQRRGLSRGHGRLVCPHPRVRGPSHLEYELTVDDVGCYSSFRVAVEQGLGLRLGHGQGALQAEAVMGPLLAGPHGFSTWPSAAASSSGLRAVAEADCIGGKLGAPDFWWLRIRQGEREQLSEPRPFRPETPPPSTLLSHARTTPASTASGLKTLGLRAQLKVKVKCRPVRYDGRKGEVFTSKPSKVVGGTPLDSSQLDLSSSAGQEDEAGGLSCGRGRGARRAGQGRGGEGRGGKGRGGDRGCGQASVEPLRPRLPHNKRAKHKPGLLRDSIDIRYSQLHYTFAACAGKAQRARPPFFDSFSRVMRSPRDARAVR